MGLVCRCGFTVWWVWGGLCVRVRFLGFDLVGFDLRFGFALCGSVVFCRCGCVTWFGLLCVGVVQFLVPGYFGFSMCLV